MIVIAMACAAGAVMTWWASPTTRVRVVAGLATPDPRWRKLRDALSTWVGRSRRDRARRDSAVEFLDSLAAELRGGQPALTALQAAGNGCCPRAVSAARISGDVVGALRADAHGVPVLASLAACWQVAEASGSALAASVTRLAESERAACDLRADVRAALAGPRASGRTMMMLPVIGLVMGVALGVDPIGWLIGSPWGLACLIGGVGLTALGVLWTARIAARAEQAL